MHRTGSYFNTIADSLKSITKECYRNSAEEEFNSKHISMTLQNFNSISIYDITVTSESKLVTFTITIHCISCTCPR